MSLYGSITRSAVSCLSYVTFMTVTSLGAHSCRPKRSECGTELGREELGLLPCREVSALVDLVEVDQVAIGAPGPCFRGSVYVLRKYRDGDRQRDLGGLLRGRNNDAASCAVLPVQPRGR